MVAVRGFLSKVTAAVRPRDRNSLWAALTALIGVLLFDLLPGLLLAVAPSLVLFFAAASRRQPPPRGGAGPAAGQRRPRRPARRRAWLPTST